MYFVGFSEGGVLVGWSGCTVAEVMDVKSLLEEGWRSHKALKLLGGVM